MLKKKQRLNKNKDFSKVFKEGRSAYGFFLGVKAVANRLDYGRLAVLVNKKVSKRAVVRNKLKRQIKAVWHARQPQSGGRDMVVICLPPAVNKNFQEIEAELTMLWKKIGINQNVAAN